MDGMGVSRPATTALLAVAAVTAVVLVVAMVFHPGIQRGCVGAKGGYGSSVCDPEAEAETAALAGPSSSTATTLAPQALGANRAGDA